MDLLNQSDPSSVSLDEAKADQILSLTTGLLLLISSQTPLIKKLLQSCKSSLYFHNFSHKFTSRIRFTEPAASQKIQ